MRKHSRDQHLKHHFPKGSLNKIWVKVEEHEYINISEMRREKKYSVIKWRPKPFSRHPKMLIKKRNKKSNAPLNYKWQSQEKRRRKKN